MKCSLKSLLVYSRYRKSSIFLQTCKTLNLDKVIQELLEMLSQGIFSCKVQPHRNSIEKNRAWRNHSCSEKAQRFTSQVAILHGIFSSLFFFILDIEVTQHDKSCLELHKRRVMNNEPTIWVRPFFYLGKS